MFNKERIIYKTAAEIEIMREAAQIVSRTLGKVAEVIKEGIKKDDDDTAKNNTNLNKRSFGMQ